MNPAIRIAAGLLALSASGLVGIALSEGYRGKAYDDSTGVQTIGFGTTAGVRPGDTITVERALMRLADDVGAYERQVRACIGDVPLFQREWDAFVSLAYNIGTGAFCGSTLVRKLKALDYAGACAEILRWNRAGGREMQGLTIRRQREFRQCTGSR